MSRRLQKLIEQKAWETLTNYNRNDSVVLEKLTEEVLSRLNEQTTGTDSGFNRWVGSPEFNKANREFIGLFDSGLALYFPLGGLFNGEPHLFALVIPANASRDLMQAFTNDYYNWRRNNPNAPVGDYQPSPDMVSPYVLRQLLRNTNLEIIAQQIPQNSDGTYNYQSANTQLMNRIRSLGFDVPFSLGDVPGLYDQNPVSFDDGPMGANRNIRTLIDLIRKKYPGFGQPTDPDGNPVGDPDVEYEDPTPSVFDILPFRRKKVPGGPGAPGGGRMAPPQQRMPRMPGQGFGGGQGMPTPGFAPPTPPMQ
jgi:hypothetical protein